MLQVPKLKLDGEDGLIDLDSMNKGLRQRAAPCVLLLVDLNLTRVGGVERTLRELSIQLMKRGWRSILCFPRNPSGSLTGLLAIPGTVLEAAPILFGKPGFRACLCFLRLVLRYRPRIVHLHFLGFLTPYPWLAKLCGAERIYFTDHLSRPEGFHVGPRTPLRRLICRLLNDPLTGVISVSEYGTRCQLAYRSMPASRLLTMYNGVDVERVCASQERGHIFRSHLGIAHDRLLVTQVSWMIPEKGISDFIQVARLVAAMNPLTEFALVGDGRCLQDFRREADHAGLGGRIHFTGQIEDPFDEGVFDATDIACQFSRWEEAFGHVIAEAMAFGKPVVATRVGGIPEIVRDGVTGFLIERGDVKAAADRVLRLAADPQLCRRLGAQGRSEVFERFALGEHVAAHLKLYGVATPQPQPVASALPDCRP